MKMRKGFTLVELLIVIVIIGILAAAMLLSSGSATASAEASNIVSNLRSLKAATMMFYADSMDAIAAVNGLLPGTVTVDALKGYTDNPERFADGKGYLFKSNTNKNWFVGVDLEKLKMSSTMDEVMKKLEGKKDTLALISTTDATNAPANTTPSITTTHKVVWMVAR